MMLPTQHIRWFPRKPQLLLPERIHGRCEAVGLRLFELQTSEPQPTCTRSRAVKRLLAVLLLKRNGFGLLGAIVCLLGRLSFSLFLLEEADGSPCPVGGLVFAVGAGIDFVGCVSDELGSNVVAGSSRTVVWRNGCVFSC